MAALKDGRLGYRSFMNIKEMRALICEMGALLFQRKLTDIAGGNISARLGDRICMTPTNAGAHCHWCLQPDQILVLDLKGNKLDGEGELSRETVIHLKLLNDFYPDGTAVVHAHPQNTLVFCAAQKPIQPVLEATLKFGEVKVVEYAPGGSNSPQLAANIAAGLQGQEELIRKQAAAVIAPWHGIFALGKDLLATVDAVERIETNARCILYSQLLTLDQSFVEEQHSALTAIMGDKSGNE